MNYSPSMKQYISDDISAKTSEIKIGASDQKEPFASPINKQPITAAGDILYNFLRSKDVFWSIYGAGEVDKAIGIAANVTKIEVIANSSTPFGS